MYDISCRGQKEVRSALTLKAQLGSLVLAWRESGGELRWIAQRVALPDAARCVFLDRMAYLLFWWVPRRRRADSVSFRSLFFESEKALGQISPAFSLLSLKKAQ